MGRAWHSHRWKGSSGFPRWLLTKSRRSPTGEEGQGEQRRGGRRGPLRAGAPTCLAGPEEALQDVAVGEQHPQGHLGGASPGVSTSWASPGGGGGAGGSASVSAGPPGGWCEAPPSARHVGL